MTVTLYSQPTCAPCKVVERQLTSAGIPYVKIDVTEDADAAERLKRNGFTGTPVISYQGQMHTMVGLPGIIQSAREAAA